METTTTTETGLADVKVRLNAIGSGVVEINGEDVAKRITALTIQAEPRRPVQVAVYHSGALVDFEGSGIIHVTPTSDLSLLQDFLGNVDAAQVEEEALKRLSWGQEGSTTDVILQVLREMAAG